MKLMNNYIDEVFYQDDALLEDVLSSIAENGMPAISVSRSSGKLLTMLVSITRSKAILEICLAKGMEGKGKLTSLELEEKYAQLAAKNLAKAGFAEQVAYMTGPALESLEKLVATGQCFDFFFIDADKDNYENYLAYCIQLASPGAFIVTDNVLAGGSVADPMATPKRYTAIMRKFNVTVANHPQLESILLPIGDGMTVSKVKK